MIGKAGVKPNVYGAAQTGGRHDEGAQAVTSTIIMIYDVCPSLQDARYCSGALIVQTTPVGA